MRWIILLILPLLFVNCSDAQTNVEKKGKVEREMKAVESFLLDVRTPAEYEQGTAGDAVNIPVNELADRIDELPADKNAKITVFCYSGGRSSRAKSILEDQGYKNIENGMTVEKVRASLKE
jgi:rhodanese-related sulfurtransferase